MGANPYSKIRSAKPGLNPVLGGEETGVNQARFSASQATATVHYESFQPGSRLRMYRYAHYRYDVELVERMDGQAFWLLRTRLHALLSTSEA